MSSGTGSNTFLCSSRGICECSGRIRYRLLPENKQTKLRQVTVTPASVTRHVTTVTEVWVGLQVPLHGVDEVPAGQEDEHRSGHLQRLDVSEKSLDELE